jgi:DNA-binding NarL/FixJ family response regulator
MYCIVQTWLPAYLYDSTAGSLPTASSLPEGDVLPQTKILVADDQPLVRRTLRSLLAKKSHWKIYEAENGKVALECIQKENPQVAVLDIVMPEMGGIETAYEIRRSAPGTKIILMSSYYTAEEAAHLARLFGDGNFIEKSQTGTELIPAINRLLPQESQAH